MRSQSELRRYSRNDHGYATPDPHVGIRWIDSAPNVDDYQSISVRGIDQEGHSIVARDCVITHCEVALYRDRLMYLGDPRIFCARARVDGAPHMVEIEFMAEHIFKVNC